MEQAASKKQIARTVAIVMMIAIVSVVSRAHIVNEIQVLNAQESISDMQALLERIHNNTLEDSDLKIIMRLVVPMSPGYDTIFVLPDRFESDASVSRVISEIGDDYVCFDVLKMAVRTIECTPFSNIVSIAHVVH